MCRSQFGIFSGTDFFFFFYLANIVGHLNRALRGVDTVGVVSSFLTVKCPVLFAVCINQKQLYILDYFLYNICTYITIFFSIKLQYILYIKRSCTVSSSPKLVVCTILICYGHYITYFFIYFYFLQIVSQTKFISKS